MQNKFSEQMALLSNRQLAEILTIKFDEYQPDAILAAELELKKRNINVTEIISEKEQEFAEHARVPEDASIKEEGLNGFIKAITFLMPWIISFALNGLFEEWYDKPAPQVIRYIALVIVIIVQFIIFGLLKSAGKQNKAQDFKNWTLNSWITIVGLFIVSLLLKINLWIPLSL